ncbi:uncharacterized protein LOC121200029 [Toxotes jaculatrix]|uniref:uncharacterized protein LOC121200029 n=1 Tax=Toxotes jaculatrix TaxID=941984 RepID=UPI001B3ABEAF|nr:uncharacterized protein LOC121200029 [Toxotes jaculatrix]
MVRFKWILFLIMFPFTATVNGRDFYITVRAGGEVTLPFENVINDQGTCDRTTWMSSDSTHVVMLFERGQIHKDAKSKSERLNVTENCSLVIKKVTVQDVGRYDCRQFDESGRQQGPVSVVLLSVVTLTEHQGSDEVTFSCSVSTYDQCRYTVKWLFSGKDVNKYNNQMKTSQSDCRADVIIPTSLFISTSMNDELLKCDVTDEFTGEVQQFPFSRQSSGEKPDKKKSTTVKTTKTSTALRDKDESATTESTSTTEPTSVHPAVIVQFSSVTVRDGGDVTLSCENLFDDQDECNSPDWTFRRSTNTAELVKRGQIGEEAKSKSDRLSVTENCSLVIEKVRGEDVGRYDCQQFDESGRQQGPVSVVLLSVVTMTGRKDDDKVTLSCSESTHDRCRHTVKWLYESKTVDKGNKDIETQSQSVCSATVTFPSSYLKKPKYDELFKCEVTDGYSKEVKLFTFSPQSSGEDTTTTTAAATTTTENSKKSSTTNMTSPAVSDSSPQSWWLYAGVAVGSAALFITAVLVMRWRRTKGNKTQMDENVGQRLNPTETQSAPETSQDTADPEDVSYASVSYTKKTNSKVQTQVRGDDDDEGDAVTYSTVKISSSSAVASTDPSNIYATVNKPNK